jgi:vitamin B12 transporter
MLRFSLPGCAFLRGKASFTVLLGALLVQAAHAQAPTAEMDPVVVTATRSAQRLADTLPHTTVITRAELDRMQTRDLLEVLVQQAGVEFARTGGFGAQASLFMRGTNSSQTLVLIDGMRLNTAIGGTATIGAINLDTIERIEVVRGNLSSLYGSEAIGGVVQIFTRGGASPGASAAAEGGAGHSRIGSLAANTSLGSTELAVAGGYREAKPFSAIDASRVIPSAFRLGANPDLDDNRNRTGSIRARQPLGERAEVAASAWITRNATDFDNTADGTNATHHENARQSSWQVSGRFNATDRWTTRLQAGETLDHSVSTSSFPFSFSAGEFQARNRQVSWINSFAFTQAIASQLGLEQLQQRGSSTSYDPVFGGALTQFDRRVRAVWTGGTARIDAHHLQLNVRHDDYSDVGNANTGLAAYGYNFTPAWRASLQYSSAFRAPSFNDLHFPGFNNPDLKPERARSLEAGLRHAQGATSFRFAIYRTKTSNLIAFDPITNAPQNIARARIDGGEIVFGTRVAETQVDISIDATSPIDEQTHERLLRRAPYRATLALARGFGPVEVGAAVTHVAARYDSDINTFGRTRLDPYTLLRATLAWRVGDKLRFTLRVENLTDERYELVSGYNTQRRGGFAGAEIRI